MTRNTDVIQLTPIKADTNFKNIFIGTSRFTDDIWDLSPFMHSPNVMASNKKINFSNFTNEKTRLLIKQYAYSQFGKVKPQTVYDLIHSRLPAFQKFCEENSINSFLEVTVAIFKDFISWLLNRVETKNILPYHAYKCSRVVEEIITKGQIYGWEVPQNCILKGLSMKIWKKALKKELEENRGHPIPTEIFNRILHVVKYQETDIIVKSAIIIQSQTGLRISEVLSLKVGCIHQSVDGYFYLEAWIPKSGKYNNETILHKIFINSWVVQTIKELEEATANLRSETKEILNSQMEKVIKDQGLSGAEKKKALVRVEQQDISDYLFISNAYRYKSAIVPKLARWNSDFLSPFIRRWKITDVEGNLYHLTSHHFRHTFVCDLVKKKIPLPFIMKHLSHLSEEMTARYFSLNDESVQKELAVKMLHPDSKIAGKRAVEIRQETTVLFKGKTVNEINEIVEELAESLSFNPLPTGVCLYDEMRGRCSDGDGCFFYNCPNYVTNTDFYPLLKQELDMLEKEMNRYKEMGRKRDYDRVYIRWEHLKPLVEELEVQLNAS